MEVHAHSHTERKKWTHYLWEFLMLFLAVFCGFLAENIREQYVEHHKEKQYMHSMITDLREDTAEIKSVIEYNINKFNGMDTLAQLLNKNLLTGEDEKSLYYLNSRYARNINTMIFSDRTIRQLLSSGNMRLISRQSISDSIMKYYGQPKDDIIGQEKVYAEASKQLLSFANDIFDNSASLLKMNADNTFYRDKKPDKMKLITYEKTVLRKYAQMIIGARDMLANYLLMLFDMRNTAEQLLVFLENEYNVK